MISRSNITENQVENVGIAPYTYECDQEIPFSRKAVNPLYCPDIFDAPSVLSEMQNICTVGDANVYVLLLQNFFQQLAQVYSNCRMTVSNGKKSFFKVFSNKA